MSKSPLPAIRQMPDRWQGNVEVMIIPVLIWIDNKRVSTWRRDSARSARTVRRRWLNPNGLG